MLSRSERSGGEERLEISQAAAGGLSIITRMIGQVGRTIAAWVGSLSCTECGGAWVW